MPRMTQIQKDLQKLQFERNTAQTEANALRYDLELAQAKATADRERLDEMHSLLAGLAHYTKAIALCELVRGDDTSAYGLVVSHLGNLQERAVTLMSRLR